MTTRLVVGLGNPGDRYAGTRHNVGFLVADEVARRGQITIRRAGHSALVGDLRLAHCRVIIAKPQTYMNLSGKAVAALLRFHNVPPTNLILIYDDMDLPVGRIRLRQQGSAGGHNGVQSVIDDLGTSVFPRIRVGIGRPPPGWEGVDWVLAPFGVEDKPLIVDAVARAADAVIEALQSDFAAAMSVFNR